jgi:hypothetical protein
MNRWPNRGRRPFFPTFSPISEGLGWSAVFAAAIVCNVLAALLAIIALKPLQARFLRLSASHAAPVVSPLTAAAAGSAELIVMRSPADPHKGFGIPSTLSMADIRQSMPL